MKKKMMAVMMMAVMAATALTGCGKAASAGEGSYTIGISPRRASRRART